MNDTFSPPNLMPAEGAKTAPTQLLKCAVLHRRGRHQEFCPAETRFQAKVINQAGNGVAGVMVYIQVPVQFRPAVMQSHLTDGGSVPEIGRSRLGEVCRTAKNRFNHGAVQGEIWAVQNGKFRVGACDVAAVFV